MMLHSPEFLLDFLIIEVLSSFDPISHSAIRFLQFREFIACGFEMALALLMFFTEHFPHCVWVMDFG